VIFSAHSHFIPSPGEIFGREFSGIRAWRAPFWIVTYLKMEASNNIETKVWKESLSLVSVPAERCGSRQVGARSRAVCREKAGFKPVRFVLRHCASRHFFCGPTFWTLVSRCISGEFFCLLHFMQRLATRLWVIMPLCNFSYQHFCAFYQRF
jgi:hypothetical protein